MPRFLNEILENNKSVPTSSNDTIADMVYVTEEEYNVLVENNQLKNNTVYMIDDELSASTENTVLWENTNIIANFATQTVNLKNNDYDYCIIFYYRSPASRTEMFGEFCEKNRITAFIYSDYYNNAARVFTRQVSVGNGTVSFDNANNNGVVDNSLLIPYKIIGCKFKEIVINKTGQSKEEMLDLFYPVGCYFETSDKNFNPNTTWGGTWSQDTMGYCTVGAVPEVGWDTWPELQLEGGEVFGEVNHTITINEMPTHYHNVNGSTSTDGAHVHSIATANGQGNLEWGYTFSYSGHNAAMNYGAFYTGGGSHYHTMNFNSAARGGGLSHNNVQPSIGVYRWHRTA